MIVHQNLNALHHVDHKFLRTHHTQYTAYNIKVIKKKKVYMRLFLFIIRLIYSFYLKIMFLKNILYSYLNISINGT